MSNLELRYRALMAKKGSLLPSEYQQVEYLESYGTQYIDTGVILDNNSRVIINGFLPTAGNQVTTYPQICGARTDYTNNFAVGFNNGNNQIFFRYHTQKADKIEGLYGGTQEGDFTLDCNKNVWSMSFSNGQSGSHIFTETGFSTNRNAYIFTSNNITGKVLAAMRLYSCKIYDNDTLIRDYLPCYRKADNATGLYDLVNGEFYANAGTNNFIVGGNV